MTSLTLTIKNAQEILRAKRPSFRKEQLEKTREIIESVREGGRKTFLSLRQKLDTIEPIAPLFLTPAAFEAAQEEMLQSDPRTYAALSQAATRIRAFAEFHKESLQPRRFERDGCVMNTRYVPVDSVGCYAPGGRFPLPSSLLMTAVPASVAGVPRIWAACPKPTLEILTACHLAGVHGLLCGGGAHAIAALAYGLEDLERVALIVGPGNSWVTAAKSLVSVDTGIDMLAGPSEVTIVADASANPELIAADWLAQAEHDPEAQCHLITVDAPDLIARVEKSLRQQLQALSTASIAAEALKHAWACRVTTWEEAAELCNRVAPEHLELHGKSLGNVRRLFKDFGALFVGENSAEVFGDYGAGPNHVLPTAGTAKYSSTLSVQNYMMFRTELEISDLSKASGVINDSIELAQLEGLAGHAQAARLRKEP